MSVAVVMLLFLGSGGGFAIAIVVLRCCLLYVFATAAVLCVSPYILLSRVAVVLDVVMFVEKIMPSRVSSDESCE